MSEPSRGNLVDRYIVLDLVGRGGMGIVLAAYDPDLDRRVALKLLQPAVFADSAEARLRLQREAQAMARLSHPHVVSVHDVGVVGDSTFIAMEFVETTLASWLLRRRSWRDILTLFLQAGRGLVAAHTAGIVHRDFKPSNVLVDRQGHARVTDFGIATLGEGSEDDLAPIGTPAYMAPEQHLGDPVDARADQFAFCVALYEALYGRRPFPGNTIEEVALRVTCNPPDAPPEDHDVPRWVWDAIEPGLRVDPAARHPTMRDLLLALEHDPEAAARRSTVLQAMIEFGMSRTVAGDADTAETVLRNALADALGAGDVRLASAAEAMLAHVIGAVRGRVGEGLERVERAAAMLAEVGGDVLVEARLHHVRGSLLAIEHRFDDAIAELERAHAAFERAVGPHAIKLAEVESQIGGALRGAGRADEALVCYEGALARALEARGTLSSEAASVLDGLAGTLQMLGRFRDAEARYREALAMREKLLGTRHMLVGDSHNHLGQLLLLSGELQAAAPHFEKALSIAEEVHGPVAPSTFAVLNNLGGLLARRGDYDGGFCHLERALAIAEHIYGPEHYETTRPLSNLGWLWMIAGRADEALALFERTLRIRQATMGDDHPEVIDALGNVAGAMTQLGRHREAVDTHRRVLAASERARGPDHPSTAMLRYNLATTLLLLAPPDIDGALPQLERARDALEAAFGPNHTQLATVIGRLGVVAQMREQYDEGARLFERTVAIYDHQGLGEHADLVAILRGLGDCLMKTGRHGEATGVLERGLEVARQQAAPPATTAVLTGMRAAAVWEVGDHQAGRALAEEARRLAIEAGEAGGPLLPYIEAWLREHV